MNYSAVLLRGRLIVTVIFIRLKSHRVCFNVDRSITLDSASGPIEASEGRWRERREAGGVAGKKEEPEDGYVHAGTYHNM